MLSFFLYLFSVHMRARTVVKTFKLCLTGLENEQSLSVTHTNTHTHTHTHIPTFELHHHVLPAHPFMCTAPPVCSLVWLAGSSESQPLSFPGSFGSWLSLLSPRQAGIVVQHWPRPQPLPRHHWLPDHICSNPLTQKDPERDSERQIDRQKETEREEERERERQRRRDRETETEK